MKRTRDGGLGICAPLQALRSKKGSDTIEFQRDIILRRMHLYRIRFELPYLAFTSLAVQRAAANTHSLRRERSRQ